MKPTSLKEAAAFFANQYIQERNKTDAIRANKEKKSKEQSDYGTTTLYQMMDEISSALPPELNLFVNSVWNRPFVIATLPLPEEDDYYVNRCQGINFNISSSGEADPYNNGSVMIDLEWKDDQPMFEIKTKDRRGYTDVATLPYAEAVFQIIQILISTAVSHRLI